MARLMLLLFAVASMIIVSCAGTFQKSSSPKYALKVSKDGKDYDEQVSVDIKKGTETFHLREASSGKDAGDIIYDFKRNLTMIRAPEEKACFLSKSTKNIPKPGELLQFLNLLTGNAPLKITPQSEVKLKVDGILKDRSGLSKEMVDVCAKLPVYRVTEGDIDLKNTTQMNDAETDVSDPAKVPAKRTKRGFWKKVCKTVCSLVCTVKCGWVCYPVCRTVCNYVCTLIWQIFG